MLLSVNTHIQETGKTSKSLEQDESLAQNGSRVIVANGINAMNKV